MVKKYINFHFLLCIPSVLERQDIYHSTVRNPIFDVEEINLLTPRSRTEWNSKCKTQKCAAGELRASGAGELQTVEMLTRPF